MRTFYLVMGGGALLMAGGVAAGAWENLRKRLFRDFGRLLLCLYTFGTSSLETKLFRHIAMRPKRDGVLLLLLFLMAASAITVADSWLENWMDPTTRPLFWLGSFAALILLMGHPLLKILYGEFYTLRFDYYMALARPYLSDLEFHLYNERFARLESKQQHMELCDEVKAVGRQRKLASRSSYRQQ